MKRFWLMLGAGVVGAGFVWFGVRTLRRKAPQPTIPPVPDDTPRAAPANAPAAVLGSAAVNEAAPAADKDVADEPPPPPPPLPLAIFGQSAADAEQDRQLWLALQYQLYRHRSEGFRSDWAFPLYATQHDLGAPLAPGSRITFGNTEYALQPFAQTTLYNEVPNWSEVQELNKQIGDAIPETGLHRDLLEASFHITGSAFVPSEAFCQFATRHNLGPALGQSIRITLGYAEYSMQVFANDTLFNRVPHWSDVKRLSELTSGDLHHALWLETYKQCGVEYDPESPAHQFALRERLGAPLSGVYPLDFEGNIISVQVFANDTIFADETNEFKRQRELERPDEVTVVPEKKKKKVFIPMIKAPGGSEQEATSLDHTIFARLPVDGQPRISQFYGYTKFASGAGARYYGQCQGRHPGIDFAVSVGTPLRAIAHGLVVYAGPTSGAPFGGSPPQVVIVRYGDVYAIYGHCSAARSRKGQIVRPGDVVALSGDLGGPHLHFELRPVPRWMLDITDSKQSGINSGVTFNPLDRFSPDLQPYFERWYRQLGGRSHFCRDDLRTQGEIRFGDAVDRRPCQG